MPTSAAIFRIDTEAKPSSLKRFFAASIIFFSFCFALLGACLGLPRCAGSLIKLSSRMLCKLRNLGCLTRQVK
jgi:hypothetical protein